MRIGIAAPIEILALEKHFPNISEEDKKLGLGGTAINIIIDGLLNAGHTVTVFTLDPRIENTRVIQGENIKVLFGSFRKSYKAKIFDFCYHEFISIKKLIEQEKVHLDIVNAHWSYEFAIGTILAKIPHLITFRDESFTILKLSKNLYRLTRLLMDFWVRKNGKCFNYNSPYLKSLIKIDGAVTPNPIRDTEITYPRKHPENNLHMKICYIANGWDYRKNPESALEAFSILIKKFPLLELHLIGSDFSPNDAGFFRMEKLGLNQNVKYRGPLSHNSLMKELNFFDIMLHTAREESFGNNLIEAMAKGIPVIAGSRSGAVPWVLGVTDCLVNIDDPIDVSNKLAKLVTDKFFYEEMSNHGIKNVSNRFSQSVVSLSYVNEYTKIVEKFNRL